MKTQIFYILCLLPVVEFSTFAAISARDPFWPIGYSPAPPPVKIPEKIEVPVTVEKIPEPKPLPVSDEEWRLARKMLNVSGYALSEKLIDGKKIKTSIVVINRKYYETGDRVKLDYNGVSFTWKISRIENNSLELINEFAERTEVKKPQTPTKTRTNNAKPKEIK